MRTGVKKLAYVSVLRKRPGRTAMELATTPMMERQRNQRENSTQAIQIANIAARLERLPLTSYQRGIFAIIATAWFFDSMDLGALTFVLRSSRRSSFRPQERVCCPA
jgi:hypothetical protein